MTARSSVSHGFSKMVYCSMTKWAPPVLPSLLPYAPCEWTFFSIADGRQARGRYAQVDQKCFGCPCAGLSQRQVVFVGAAFVAVALDRHL